MDLYLNSALTEVLAVRMDAEDTLRHQQEEAARKVVKYQRKQAKFQRLRNQNKSQLAAFLSAETGVRIPPNAQFGVVTDGRGVVAGLPDAPKEQTPAAPPPPPPKAPDAAPPGDAAGAAGAVDASRATADAPKEERDGKILPMPVGAGNGASQEVSS